MQTGSNKVQTGINRCIKKAGSKRKEVTGAGWCKGSSMNNQEKNLFRKEFTGANRNSLAHTLHTQKKQTKTGIKRCIKEAGSM